MLYYLLWSPNGDGTSPSRLCPTKTVGCKKKIYGSTTGHRGGNQAQIDWEYSQGVGKKPFTSLDDRVAWSHFETSVREVNKCNAKIRWTVKSEGLQKEYLTSVVVFGGQWPYSWTHRNEMPFYSVRWQHTAHRKRHIPRGAQRLPSKTTSVHRFLVQYEVTVWQPCLNRYYGLHDELQREHSQQQTTWGSETGN